MTPRAAPRRWRRRSASSTARSRRRAAAVNERAETLSALAAGARGGRDRRGDRRRTWSSSGELAFTPEAGRGASSSARSPNGGRPIDAAHAPRRRRCARRTTASRASYAELMGDQLLVTEVVVGRRPPIATDEAHRLRHRDAGRSSSGRDRSTLDAAGIAGTFEIDGKTRAIGDDAGGRRDRHGDAAAVAAGREARRRSRRRRRRACRMPIAGRGGGGAARCSARDLADRRR